MIKLYPKLEARAIELLNQGLSAPEVTTTLENEGVIKVRTYWDEQAKTCKNETYVLLTGSMKIIKGRKVKQITKTISWFANTPSQKEIK